LTRRVRAVVLPPPPFVGPFFFEPLFLHGFLAAFDSQLFAPSYRSPPPTFFFTTVRDFFESLGSPSRAPDGGSDKNALQPTPLFSIITRLLERARREELGEFSSTKKRFTSARSPRGFFPCFNIRLFPQMDPLGEDGAPRASPTFPFFLPATVGCVLVREIFSRRPAFSFSYDRNHELL